VAGGEWAGFEKPTAEAAAVVSGFGLGRPEEHDERDCSNGGRSDEKPAPIHDAKMRWEASRFNKQQTGKLQNSRSKPKGNFNR
jgi:hypothetical protein